MDVLSHGLWGGLPFLKKGRKRYGTAVAFGMLPDILAFFPYTPQAWLAGRAVRAHGDWSQPPDPGVFPDYVFIFYRFTHSLVVFAAFFFLVWRTRRKAYGEMWSWGFHVLTDIPTHTLKFFPTPFLWPIANLYVDGFAWGVPPFTWVNYALLCCAYGIWYILSRER